MGCRAVVSWGNGGSSGSSSGREVDTKNVQCMYILQCSAFESGRMVVFVWGARFAGLGSVAELRQPQNDAG